MGLRGRRARLRRSRVPSGWLVRALAALVVLAGVATLSGVAPTPAVADNGEALIDVTVTPLSPIYGDTLRVSGSITDVSDSCISFPFDCDTPTGTVFVREGLPGGGYLEYGSLPVVPYDGGNDDLSFFGPLDIPDLDAGVHTLYFVYIGDFVSDALPMVTRTIAKADCNVALSQSLEYSALGQEVRFTADLGGLGHPGTVSFYDATDALLATVPTVFSAIASWDTTALPSGTHVIRAVYNGDSNHNSCTSSTVTHVTDPAPPTAVADSATTQVNQPVAFDPAANDLNPGGGPLVVEFLESPAGGEISGPAPGTTTFTYTPSPGFFGDDTFAYLVRDAVGQASESEVTIVVECTPTPVGDSYSTPFETALTVVEPGVATNDTVCDQDVELVDPPDHGDATLSSFGALQYTPDDGFSGDDTLTYRLSGPNASTATVTITVGPAPCEIELVNDQLSVDEDGVLELAAPGVAGNDTTCGLDAVIVDDADRGTLTLHPDGGLSYTPDPDLFGEDSFSYALDDPDLASPVGEGIQALVGTPATVTITIVDTPDDPDNPDPDDPDPDDPTNPAVAGGNTPRARPTSAVAGAGQSLEAAPPAASLPATGGELFRLVLLAMALALLGATATLVGDRGTRRV